jgi:predicted 3-demethylubiquinone-9 3-methyltransferase (glyoxalase superfamily)
MQQKIIPSLWFDGDAEDAAKYYVSVFKDGKLRNVTYYNEAVPDKAGTVLTAEWEVLGMRFVGINGGPQFQFSEAVSFQIICEDQDEVDYYWEKLTADGGQDGPCGWCKDKFGLSWQVVPTGMDEALSDRDPERARRAMDAMMKMRKIDIAAIHAAADGVPA